MNNVQSGNSVTPNIIDSSIYRLNLSTMNWEKFNYRNKDMIVTGYSFYLNDYCFQYGNIKSVIIHPREFKYLILKNENCGLTNGTELYQVDGNKIYSRSHGSGVVMHMDTFDVKKIWTKNEKNAKFLNESPEVRSTESSSNTTCIILALAILIVTTISYYFIRKFKQNRNSGTAKTETTEFFEDFEVHWNADKAILDCKKSTLSSDELDELLGINNLNNDTKKLKRHRILNEFEKNYPNLITRMKDPNDRRKYIYKLNQSNIKNITS